MAAQVETAVLHQEVLVEWEAVETVVREQTVAVVEGEVITVMVA